MSLYGLMWAYFSIYESAHGRDFSGAVQRTTGFSIKVGCNNRICNIQHMRSAARREDIVLKYGIKSQEVAYILYHPHVDIFAVAGDRILVNKNPRLRVPEFPSPADTNIFEFKGTPDEVVYHRRITLKEIYLEKNDRWDF